MFIFTITYNFDGSSVAKKCNSMEERNYALEDCAHYRIFEV